MKKSFRLLVCCVLLSCMLFSMIGVSHAATISIILDPGTQRSITIPPEGATIRVKLNPSASVVRATVSTSISWLSARVQSDYILITVPANSSTSKRTGVINFYQSGQSYSLRIIQEAFTISASSLTFRAEGDTRSITASHDCEVLGTVPSWLHITKSGKVFTIKADANKTAAAKTCTLTFSYKNGAFKRTVTCTSQKGSAIGIPAEIVISSGGGNLSLNPSGKIIRVQIPPKVDWLRVLKIGDIIIIRVDPNTTGQTRSAVITFIFSDGKTLACKIVQKPN